MRSHKGAKLPDDFQHGGFARSDVAPDKQPLVRVKVAVIVHHRPVNDVVVCRFHFFPHCEARADGNGTLHEKRLVFANPR